MDEYFEAVRALPDCFAQALGQIGPEAAAQIHEVRLRTGCPLWLNVNGTLRPAGSLPGCPPGLRQLRPSAAQMEQALYTLCGGSVPTHQAELAGGFLTLPGGHRVIRLVDIGVVFHARLVDLHGVDGMPSQDLIGVVQDAGPGALALDHIQGDHWEDARFNDITEHIARVDTGQLPEVSHDDCLGAAGNGREQGGGQVDANHGELIHHHTVAGDRGFGLSILVYDDVQGPVDGAGGEPGRPAGHLGGLAGGRHDAG